MKFNGFKKGLAATLAVCVMATSSAFVYANEQPETRNVDFVFTDVTGNEASLKGEVKIQVGIKGPAGTLKTVQNKVEFSKNFKYKSIQFMQGTNSMAQGVAHIATGVAKANDDGYLVAGISSVRTGIAVSENNVTPLYIITFEKDSSDLITVSGDKTSSHCTYMDGIKGYTDDTLSADDKLTDVPASVVDRASVKAGIKLTFDVVKKLGSISDNYKTTDIFVKLTNKDTNYTIYSDLSNAKYPTGNRSNKPGDPEFLFENNIVEGTYTVEISGPGYISHSEDITFDSNKTIEYTNADFVPGDVTGDGKIDIKDKQAYEKLIADNDYSLSADFNRDTKVDAQDNMFENIKEDNTGDNTGDNGNTGGTTGDNGNGSTGNGGTGGNGGGSGGGGGTGGSAGGSTGGGSTGGGGFGGGTTTTPTTPSTTKTFTDLANYGWAENAIYTLKDKGIISGISNTEYAPANNIKRGDFILILSRMLKLENTFTENFADVPESAYYYDALGKAKAAGIASGDGVNFMPENTITRQDLITLAYRAFLNAGYIEETTDYSVLDQFADKAEITDYATAPLASMVAAGIITGDGTNVNPKGFATRAEVAVMCERLLALMK